MHIKCAFYRKIAIPEVVSQQEHSLSVVDEAPRVLPPPGMSFVAVERTTEGANMEPAYLERVNANLRMYRQILCSDRIGI